MIVVRYCITQLFVRLARYVLCLRLSRLGASTMFSIRPSVRPSVRLSVTNLVNTIFWKWMNRLCCKLVNDVGRRNSQLWGSQGQRWTVKVTRAEVEAWRRCHSRPRRSSGFSSLASVDVVKWTLLSRLLIHSLRVVDNRPMPGLLAFAFVE